MWLLSEFLDEYFVLHWWQEYFLRVIIRHSESDSDSESVYPVTGNFSFSVIEVVSTSSMEIFIRRALLPDLIVSAIPNENTSGLEVGTIPSSSSSSSSIIIVFVSPDIVFDLRRRLLSDLILSAIPFENPFMSGSCCLDVAFVLSLSWIVSSIPSSFWVVSSFSASFSFSSLQTDSREDKPKHKSTY